MKSFLLALALILFCGCASVQKRYASTSTQQLQLRHHQIVKYLDATKGQFSFKFGPPGYMMMQGDPRADRIKELEEIEQELFRRYNSGDSAAHLPMFGTR